MQHVNPPEHMCWKTVEGGHTYYHRLLTYHIAQKESLVANINGSKFFIHAVRKFQSDNLTGKNQKTTNLYKAL